MVGAPATFFVNTLDIRRGVHYIVVMQFTTTTEGTMDTTTQPGTHMLHYNPSTGRIVRVVTVIEVNGEAATVEHANNPNKGKRYIVSTAKLAPVAS